MNRRHFFATAGAALAAMPSASHAAQPAARPKIRAGFLGASYSHGPAKLKIVIDSAHWELTGVWDETDAGRETCRKLGAPLAAQKEVLEGSDVVFVESDIGDHARHGMLALRANRHVHVEKPPATTLAEMQEMVGLAKEKGKLMQVGYMWRHHPGFAAVLEAARQGWLGDIFMVRAHIANHLAQARRPDWAAFKGGSMFELGSHLVDAIVRLLGRPKEVRPCARHHGDFADGLRDNHAVVMEFDRALAVLTNTAMQASGTPARGFEVLGTNGSAVLQPIEPPLLKIDLVKAAGPYAAGAQSLPFQYTRYLGDFAELESSLRGQRPLGVDLETELLVHQTLLRASDMM